MKYLKDKKNEYIAYADLIISKRKSFYKNFKIKDIKNDVILSKDYDYLYYLRNDYIYYNFVSEAMNERYFNKDDYVAIFLTLTLDSKAHQYKQNKKKQLILNPKYDEKITINRGYKILNKFFRDMYKNFKINGKYTHFDFVKVVEPHSDFTPHLHSIIYLKRSDLSNFCSYVDSMIAKNGYMGRYEIEILRNIKRGNAYIIKYLQKSFIDDLNEDDLKMFLGWRLKNKIRMFSSSQFLIQRSIFKKVGFSKLSKELLNSSDYFGTDNLYKIYSQVVLGKIYFDKNIDKCKKFNDDSVDRILHFEILKSKIKKKNEYWDKYYKELKRYNDLFIKLEIIQEDKKIFDFFNDFLFYNYELSFEEFELEPDEKMIDLFLISLEKKIFYTYYKIDSFRFWKFGNPIPFYDNSNFKVINKFIKSEKSYQAIPKSVKFKINDYTKEKVIVKSVSKMSDIEKFLYKQELQAEKENPFADDRYLKHIEDKEYILNKFI